MSRLVFNFLGVAICLTFASALAGQEASEGSKARVELCWVETTPIEGLTRQKGFQTSCDPKDMGYPHIKPALVLTPSNVTEAVLTSHHFGGGRQYMVTIHLTKKARDQLAATVRDKRSKLLTVVIDGKCWGLHYYVLDEEKRFVPEQARASTFRPSVGFFSSEWEASRLLNAFEQGADDAKVLDDEFRETR